MKKFFLQIIIFLLISVPSFAAQQTDSDDDTLQLLNIGWWEKYNDEYLKENLITVYKNNYDLKNAALKIKENEQIVKMQFANELPSIGFAGDLNRDLQAPRQQFGTMYIPKYSQYNYILPITAAYEIDIWGLNRLKTKSAKQQTQIAKQAQRAVYISLTSDFASDYFNLIKADKLLQIQDELISIQEQILTMTEEKYKTGLCSVNDVLYEQKYLTSLKEEKNRHELIKNLLNETLKVYLAGDEDIKYNDYDKVTVLKNIPQEYSSTVIENRPDFLSQEANIRKIGFDVKAAKREFLPKFIIAGQAGFNAYHLNSIFNSVSQMLNVGILPSFDIFSGGRKLALLKLKKYQYEEALNDYQKTLLTAVKELNSGLSEYKTADKNYKESVKRVNMQQKIYNLAADKNKIGASSNIDTLFAREAFLLTQKDEISNKINLIISTIGLYKAAGGINLYQLNETDL